ncbi:nucleotidyltransferase family protein [Alisedimentitalea sp. MJ-SS2]|uniref:nucleotidyltransferase family protein n=1 Tax=Aliisedimentitalea sp. MJ-SS2 TaxID=3049795 RepID=UPI00290A7D51|nr:nucleotidyltransferase family protein [Alisedimentitalea sp. MJ-SS2]MDU8927360.1 nucleotidyltransferase family protein [Alisedimentitalea sp. MJ-SS2]
MKPSQGIDGFLARALGGPVVWDDTIDADKCVERALYGGIAGLLLGQKEWPEEVLEPLRQQARGQAMWELRHRAVLSDLLEAMSARGLRVLVLKGTALAYDLYDEPASRARWDSDLLIDPEELAVARDVLNAQGFGQPVGMNLSDDLKSQEEWTKHVGETTHSIDLHWSIMNARALRGIVPFDDLWGEAQLLEALSPHARRMSRVDALIFACLHRAKHVSSPYMVNGVRFFGGDRLIWAEDIFLLAEALDQAEWARLVDKAAALGAAAVCLDGLNIAQVRLGCKIPGDVIDALNDQTKGSPTEQYLLQANATQQAMQNFKALPGVWAKIRFLRQNVFPPRGFMEQKYPDMKGALLWRLYARRIIDFLRR